MLLSIKAFIIVSKVNYRDVQQDYKELWIIRLLVLLEYVFQPSRGCAINRCQCADAFSY